MRKKIEKLGSAVISEIIVPDDEDIIAKAVLDMKEKGCEVIITCGGLSVDPDDVTAEGVAKAELKLSLTGAGNARSYGAGCRAWRYSDTRSTGCRYIQANYYYRCITAAYACR